MRAVSKEVIRNKEDGFMVQVDEWRKLEEPLTWLLQHPGEIKNFGRKGRKRVEASFSLKAMVKEIEEVYMAIGNRQSGTANREYYYPEVA
jgi:glycosyltransferase involved in cell wall biosynthesis